jgi:hypothetical protein
MKKESQPETSKDDLPFDLEEVTELLGQPLMLSQLQLKLKAQQKGPQKPQPKK